MGIFSNLFGSSNFDKEKQLKFQKLEKEFEGNQKIINSFKASWLTSRGNHLGQQGKLDLAIIDFKEAIELKPTHIPAYTGLGVAYREKGMFGEALKILQEASRKIKYLQEPSKTGIKLELYNVITSVYLSMGNKYKALEYAKKALGIANNPIRKKYKGISLNAGVINENETDDSEMIEMLEELIKELETESKGRRN